MERIIDVYYDRYGYPFKDRELTARFPVVGSEFLGASQTTTIRFHYEQIGTDENVYTVESKRPDGKTGSQLLSKNTTEHYAEMSLSGWYSACKGDLFLSLKVYRGGTTATYNETTQLWEVNGVPVIESTGAIKLAINYTPMGRYENYNDAVSTYQDVLAALGDKLDTIKGIVGVSGLSQVDTTKYEEGQLFFNIDDKALYQLVNGSIVPFLEVYSKSETDALLGGKADKSTTYTKTETDTLLSSKQPLLDSGTNIKTINGESLLGSGNIVIQGGGGSAEWGSIGGNIADQTDLQNEFQDIREVAEGKCKTWVLSYSITSFTGMSYQNSLYYDPTSGEFKEFESAEQFNTWTSGLQIINSYFNSQDASVNIGFNVTTRVLIFNEGSKNLFVKVADAFTTQYKLFHRGDVILITEINVPDRWYNAANAVWGATFLKLETSKIDLDNYSTKTETSTEVNKVAHDIATEYDESTLYGIGDLCIKEKLLYKCNTNDTTGTWDSTKWDLTTVNSELGIIKGSYAKLDENNTFSGQQNIFTNGINNNIFRDTSGTQYLEFTSSLKISSSRNIVPNGSKYIGESNNSWARGYFINLYLSDGINPNTNGYKLTLPDTSSWTANKEIATGIKEISAPSSISLTDDEYNLFTSGKIIKINGTFLGLNNPTLVLSGNNANFYWGTIIGGSGSLENTLSTYYIVISSKQIFLGSNNDRYEVLKSIKSINGTDIDSIINGTFNVINASAIASNNQLTPEQYDLITNGKPTLIKGTLLGITDLLFLLVSQSTNQLRIKGIYKEGYGVIKEAIFSVNASNVISKYIDIVSYDGSKQNLSNVGTLNGTDITNFYKKPSSSVSLSDGDTITNSTLKSLIQNEQPIKLNGFTCYFSCDDGTNYQYVSTRYDATANKNHINVITIDKSTWVATFHTSDIAV